MPNTTISLLCKAPGGPPVGDAFTITCYTCGFPSSKEWAQRVRSRPSSSSPILNKPYYPFLLQLRPPPNAMLHDDGSAFLCAFCHASLEAQWHNFEKGQGQGPINSRERVYSVHKFVCAVCSVETYRKRVRALPFQEFPFLAKERQPGSLTLGNNPLAIVCLDCSETLWSQSAEYDRWGLPIQKRHFNWMLRQPPPENSEEATVARLPNGETQFPRCPPTEPRIHREPEPKPVQISGPAPSYRVSKTSRAESYNSKSSGSRKSSSSSIGPMELSNPGQTVPIVTVAPWASHHNTPPTAVRKDSITIPMMTSVSGSKYDMTDANAYMADQQARSSHEIFQQQRGTPPTSVQAPSFLPTAGTLGSYHWGGAGGRDIVGEPFHFQPTGLESRVISTQNTNWTSWLPPSPQADLLRYQTYLSSIGNRSFSVPETYYSPSTHGLFSIPTSTEAVTVSGTDLQSSPYNIPTFIPTSNSGSPHGISHSTQQQEAPQAQSSRRVSSHNGSSLSSDSDSHSSLRRTSRIQDSSASLLRKSSLGKLGKISDHRRTIAHINPKKGITKNNYMALAEAEGERLMSIPMGVKKCADRTRTEKSEQTTALTNKLRPARTSLPNSALESLQTEPINYCFSATPAPVQRSESAMDLSVPTTLKSLNQPKSPSTAGVPRRTSNFLISYLCGDSNSRGSESGTEQESRDSVIVTMSQSGSPKPLPEAPFVIPEPVVAEKPNMAEPIVSIRSESPELQSVANHKPDPEPQINGNGESEVLKTNPEESMEVSKAEESIICEEPTFEKPKNDEPMTVDVKEVEKPKEFKIVNEKEFVEKAIQEFRKQEEAKLKASRDAEEAKKGFLVLFDLITAEQKSEIELKTLERRFDMKSLPPLKLMPKLSPEQKVNEELERNLFMTVFEDASLKQGSGDPDQLRFMSRLGLKQASRTEKYRREQNWRLMLTERMLREKRGTHLVGPKRPWDNYLQASKHLLTSGTKLARRHSTGSYGDGPGPVALMRSLSVTLPPISNDFNRSSGIHSADLLTTVESRNHAMALKEADSKEANSIQREPVITYPKYIPSYALGTDKLKETEDPEMPEAKVTKSESTKMPQVSVLNVPLVARSFAVSYEDILLHGQGIPIPKRPLPNICKIPVISGNMKSNLSTEENTTPPAAEDGPERKPKAHSNGGGYHSGGKPNANNGNSGRRHLRRSGGLPWPGVDSIIQRSAYQWKDTKEEIESVMKQAVQIKPEDKIRKRVSSDLKRLRKSLSSQQAEMKVLVKRLKRK